MRLDNEASIQNVVAISSGSICIDSALGVGGFLEEGLLKFMVLRHLERQHWHYML